MKKKFKLGVRPHPTLKILNMKLKFAMIFFLVNVVNTFGTKSDAQEVKISLNMQNNTVEQVIDEIERQSEFCFIFNQKEIDVDRMVNIHKESRLIDEILPDLLIGTNVKYSILNNKILLTATDLSEKNILTSISKNESYQASVSGKITNASTGDAMPGVNIQIKGTTLGTISDINGTYSLSIPARDVVLIFSFIGYQSKEIAISGQSVINVTLESQITGLEEVVVIGYGTQKKETLTGAVAQIKSEDIVATKTPSVAAAIQGKIVGVQIRQQTGEPGVFNSRISIRGFGEPLLVIDGVVRDGMSDLERLNPDDIESMSVLKDASASIYGMNAANGVIIVTTKKGVSGKTEFTLSSIYTLKKPTNDLDNLTVNAYTLRSMFGEMERNSLLPVSTSASELEKWKQGTEPGYTDFNWWDEMVSNYVGTKDFNFSARGGSDKVTFFTSAGYMDDTGYFKENSAERYKRYTSRTNIEADLVEGLRLGISFYGRYENIIQPSSGTAWTMKRIITNDRGIGPYTLANNGHLSIVPAENRNIVAELSKDISGYNQNLNFQYQSTVNLDYDLPFVKGLSVGVLAAYDGATGDRRALNKTYQLYDYRTDQPVGAPSKPSFSSTMRHMIRKNIQNKISYKTSIGGDHNISTVIVNDIRRVDNTYLNGRRQYDDLFTKDIINQGSLTNQSTTGYRDEEAYVSFLGRFNYDFRSKYLLEFTLRSDGSYRYSPKQRWGTFPAVSLGWRIGQEAFFKDIFPFISDLKIRGSWGMSGIDAGNAFEYYEGYQFGSIGQSGYVFNENILTLGMVAPGVVNDNLSWVNTKTLDIGLDLELWNGKFMFTTDYFQRVEEGLLATRITSVPNTFGATFPQENLNSQITKGLEFSASYRNTIGKFNYGASANVTLSRLFYLHREQEPYRSTWSKWKSATDGDGRIQGRVWGYERDGIWTNLNEYETAILLGSTYGNSRMLPGMDKIIDTNGDGIIDSNDQLPIMWSGAGTNPPLQFGFSTYTHYMNFDLNILVAGGAMFSMSQGRGSQWGYGTSAPVFYTRYLDRWHTQNPTDNPFDPATEWVPGKWEALTAVNTGTTTSLSTDKWRMPATYLRVKTIELGYNVPEKFTNKIRFTGIRAFINANNILTFCHEGLKMLDPERDEGSFSAGNTYPIMKSFNFGLELKF